ncbi:MAG: thymidylate synthase [Nanoarchaeota archaeon]|nr:thymidylate synthase [Nanoarchaeota archaeon]
MEDLKPICCLKARDLDDAWATALFACLEQNEDGSFKYSQRYANDRGSYVGQERLEIDTFIMDITHPGSGPLVPVMPYGKEHLAPTSEEVAREYLSYLLTDAKQPNEQYTYGERLVGPRIPLTLKVNSLEEKIDMPLGVNPVQEVINMYKKDGHNTNQATLEVGMPSDVLLPDPPCLRLIDTRIRNETLHFMVYFRSWDLYNGFPVNLAGLQQMKEYMASEIGVKDGQIRAMSKGLHLYDDMWENAFIRLNKEPTIKRRRDKE